MNNTTPTPSQNKINLLSLKNDLEHIIKSIDEDEAVELRGSSRLVIDFNFMDVYEHQATKIHIDIEGNFVIISDTFAAGFFQHINSKNASQNAIAMLFSTYFLLNYKKYDIDILLFNKEQLCAYIDELLHVNLQDSLNVEEEPFLNEFSSFDEFVVTVSEYCYDFIKERRKWNKKYTDFEELYLEAESYSEFDTEIFTHFVTTMNSRYDNTEETVNVWHVKQNNLQAWHTAKKSLRELCYSAYMDIKELQVDKSELAQQYEDVHSLSDFKPKISKNEIALLIPVSTEVIDLEQYGGDGMSFGYIADEGRVTIVTYVADYSEEAKEIISLAKVIKDFKLDKPSSGVQPIDMFEYDKSIEEEFINTLELTEDDIEFHETNSVKEVYEKGYWNWSEKWRKSHEELEEKINKVVGEKRLVLINESLELYIDDNKDYFFTTPYHNHGYLTKADRTDAELYVKAFEKFNSDKAELNRKKEKVSSLIQIITRKYENDKQ